MAVELVRSAMEKRVGGWACEIDDGEKVCGGRKKRWRGTDERDTENEMKKESKIIKGNVNA